ncbi:MAG: 2-aminoethylphosphonate--pyruvate transaminase [Rhodospirillales bacterium]|jgi:2-aminoethylphosphonate-pyruvate transaminase|nr:2-aminoethylphosphonate--pyruvate transaminase [Rhodospirillales bacterium]
MAPERPAPLLLTPGPLTTAVATRRAMLDDWGSRDQAFIAMTARVRARLTHLVNGGESHVCVPLQGSGTFAIEATLGTLVPVGGKALVLVNGAYGRRMAGILERLGRRHETLETAENATPDPDALAARLAGDPSITHVAAVHCETTSGILNPIAPLAAVVAGHNRRLIVDAMSAFGGIPLDVRHVPCDAVVASANKCLEGVPGLAFAIIRKDALAASGGNAHSVSLDLHDQWRAMEGNGQWRFTPPTQVLAALDRALALLGEEGGVPARHARYSANCRVLVDGLRRLGFETLLPDALQAPIIVTVRMPADPAFRFDAFYDGLSERGFIIYPGKLTEVPSFRIGCIGAVHPRDMEAAVGAVGAVMADLGVASGRPR